MWRSAGSTITEFAPWTYPFGVTRIQAFILTVCSWVFGTLILVGLGASPRDSALVVLVIVVQGVGGGYLWSLVSRDRACGALELIGMGLVLGSALAVMSGILIRPFISSALNSLLPSVILLLVFATRSWRLRSRWKPTSFSDWVFAGPALGGLLAGLAVLVVNLQRYPLRWGGFWDQYHPDMVFFEALSNSAGQYGGSDSVFMVGADIRYHWFSYAWVGQVTELSGSQPFVVLTRALPIVALIATVAVALAWTRRLVVSANVGSPRFAKVLPWLVVALIVTGGYLGALNGTILNFDSPSQALGTAWLMGLILVFLRIVHEAGGKDSRLVFVGQILILGVLTGVVTGAKVSSGVLVIVAIGFVAVMGLLVRAKWAKLAWVAFATAVLGFVLVYLTVIMGSASPGGLRFLSWLSRASTVQGLDSSPEIRGVILGTLGLTLAIGARWVGGLWLLREHTWRMRPETFLGIGLGIGSIVPLWVFSQGLNETWFALTASAPLSVLGAFGVWLAWNSLGLGVKTAAFSLGVAIISLVLVSYIWTDQVWESGFGRFWAPWFGYLVSLLAGLIVAILVREKKLVTLLVVATTVLTLQASAARVVPVAGSILGGSRDGAGLTTAELADTSVTESQSVTKVNEVIAPGSTLVDHGWSQDEINAALYLQANAANSDVVVTNETQGSVIPALSGLRAYITGAVYQEGYGGERSVVKIPARIELSRRFIASPSKEDFLVLCTEGVKWIWVSKFLDPGFVGTPFGVTVVSNASVDLVEIQSCES